MTVKAMRLVFKTENERITVIHAAQWLSLPGRDLSNFTPEELGTIVAKLARDYLDSLRGQQTGPAEGKGKTG